METHSEQQQQFVKWLRDEIKNVTFTTDEGINAFAKDLLKQKAKGKRRDKFITYIEILIEYTAGITTDEEGDEIIQAIAEKIADHLLPDSVTAMESDSEQQQLTAEEQNFVEWLRDEIKNVTFIRDEGINAFAKDMLDIRGRGKSRDAITFAIETTLKIGSRGGTITVAAPPDGNKDEIIQAIAEKIADHLLGSISDTNKERTFVSIAFQIAEGEEKLKHDLDYKAFTKYVDDIFDKYYPHPKKLSKGEGYIAPYFPFVQSSGMGKTKLLYHFVKNNPMPSNGKSDVTTKRVKTKRSESFSKSSPRLFEAKLILCRAQTPNDTNNEIKVFNEFFDYQSMSSKIRNKTFEEAYKFVKEELDPYIVTLEGDSQRNVVLLFDEAHYLLKSIELRRDTTLNVEYEALLFRLVRLWLTDKRKKEDKRAWVAAVFSGTNSNLRNYRSIDDSLNSSGDSRDMRAKEKEFFYPRGDNVFDEFFSLTTLGCLRDEAPIVAGHQEPAMAQSEYWEAIPYGRPLFAKMLSQGQLTFEKLPTIAGRMLMIEKDETTWSLDGAKYACLMSILGTRIQMGQTSMRIASSLVADAYANLVGVSTDTARICFGPDPVCARIAMCLMDEHWITRISNDSNLLTVKGASKKWWVGKACELFSKGLALPEKGDFGEVMVGLYLLFCADEERKILNSIGPTDHHFWYQSFSVRLDRLVVRLLRGGAAGGAAPTRAAPTRAAPTRAAAASAAAAGGSAAGVFFFNTIQVCRNYLRGYDQCWKELGGQDFLKHLYHAGVGFYTFAGCKTIDMVFPLKRLSAEGQPDTFYPMVVSVKSRAKFSPEEVRTALAAMAKKAKAAKWKTGLCLLVVLGPEVSPSISKKQLLSSSVVQEMQNVQNSKVPCKVLYMPKNDEFGLSEAFDAVVSVEEMPEILSSHSFATFHEGTKDPHFLSKCFRSNPKKRSGDEGYLLMKALMKVPEENHDRLDAKETGPIEPPENHDHEAPGRKRQGGKSTKRS